MAEATPSGQVLKEFVDNLLDDLVGGRLTPDEAIIASQQYPYLRALIGEHRDEITLALQDEGGLRVVLERTLRAAAAAINKELPQFQAEKPDGQLSPNDIVARARSFRDARSEVLTATRRQGARVVELRKTFIHQLVQNWVEQTRTLIDKEKQQEASAAITMELERGLMGGDLSSTDLTARVHHALAGAGVGEAAATIIQREAAPIQQELAIATQKLAGVAAIPKELVIQLNAPRPARFATIAIQTVFSTTLSPSAALTRAASLTRAAEALTSPPKKGGDVTAAGVFFRAFASGPTQKAFAAAADALLNQLSPLARQEVIKATFSRAIEGALAKTEVLTSALGRDFVESELFRLVVEGARKEFSRGAGGGAGVKQARGALEDVVGSLLRGPVMEPLVGSPREMILSYFALLAIEAGLPRDKKVLFPDHSPAVTALSLLLGGQPADARITIIKSAGFTSLSTFQAAASQISQKLPSWQAFYVILLASGAPTVYTSFIAPTVASMGGVSGGATPSSIFESAVGGPVGAIGGGLSAAFGLVGRGLSGVALGLGGGLVGMLFGGGLGSLFNKLRGPRQPEGFFDDMPKFMALVVVAVIVVLFIFPTFFNSILTSRAAKYAALLVNSQEPNTGGPYDPAEDMVSVDPAPYDGDFSCPVGRQPVSQGPFEAGESHERMCAYDFSAPKGTVVRTTHYGCISAVVTGIPVDQYQERSYGNYVKLKGKTPDEKTYYTLYGHMYDINPDLALGGCYGPGTIIGRVDATGSTYTYVGGKKKLGGATHLHYEYKGESGGCIELPAECR